MTAKISIVVRLAVLLSLVGNAVSAGVLPARAQEAMNGTELQAAAVDDIESENRLTSQPVEEVTQRQWTTLSQRTV